MDRQVSQMAHLAGDLLDRSRIPTGGVRLQREPIDLAAVLTTVIDSYRAVFEVARHKISFTAPTDRITVDSDRARLTQVFSNSLHNATRYTPIGGRIDLQLHKEGEEAVVRGRWRCPHSRRNAHLHL